MPTSKDASDTKQERVEYVRQKIRQHGFSGRLFFLRQGGSPMNPDDTADFEKIQNEKWQMPKSWTGVIHRFLARRSIVSIGDTSSLNPLFSYLGIPPPSQQDSVEEAFARLIRPIVATRARHLLRSLHQKGYIQTDFVGRKSWDENARAVFSSESWTGQGSNLPTRALPNNLGNLRQRCIQEISQCDCSTGSDKVQEGLGLFCAIFYGFIGKDGAGSYTLDEAAFLVILSMYLVRRDADWRADRIGRKWGLLLEEKETPYDERISVSQILQSNNAHQYWEGAKEFMTSMMTRLDPSTRHEESSESFEDSDDLSPDPPDPSASSIRSHLLESPKRLSLSGTNIAHREPSTVLDPRPSQKVPRGNERQHSKAQAVERQPPKRKVNQISTRQCKRQRNGMD